MKLKNRQKGGREVSLAKYNDGRKNYLMECEGN